MVALLPEKHEDDPLDTEAEISIAQEYSRIDENFNREVSPVPKHMKIFKVPTFTSPANKIKLIEMSSGMDANRVT